MITIDLLPPEYRQKHRTPLKYMLAVAGAVAVNTSLFAYWGWTAFGISAEVKSELLVLRDTHDGLQAQISYHKSLEKESQVYRSREEMLGEVTQRRVNWTQRVDQLVDVINRGGDGEKYLVWLDDLTVDQTENKRRSSYGQIKSKGYSGSASFADVANFLEDLQQSELMADFMPPGKPEGTQSTKDEGLYPSEIISFPLEMDLRSPEDRLKARGVKPKPGDAKGKAQKPAATKKPEATTKEEGQ